MLSLFLQSDCWRFTSSIRFLIRSDLSSADEPFSACSREFLLRSDLKVKPRHRTKPNLDIKRVFNTPF